ncbi:MAG: GNAT family N-acetyltransferase, partial [Nocardioidaceae bacterium]|nr:GNAT family N-acetyltransferase [Nocardioidaceae bacterium]
MAWSTTSDVEAFAEAALAFLSERPVEHTALLTETAYLRARSVATTDQHFGWWRDGSGAVGGAFVQAPQHPVLLSRVPPPAVTALVDALPRRVPVGVDGRDAPLVVEAWRRRGLDL